tara:strand:- start:255 stop:488 length:234 start_codon:yes stop_codon:yes gene_type:complete
MKKSKSPGIRIKRAVTELKEKSNSYEMGTFILEQIILQGMEQLDQELKEGKLDRSIIAPGLYQETLNILKKHIQFNY